MAHFLRVRSATPRPRYHTSPFSRGPWHTSCAFDQLRRGQGTIRPPSPGDHGTLPARSISYAEAKVPYVPLLQGTMAHFLRVRSATPRQRYHTSPFSRGPWHTSCAFDQLRRGKGTIRPPSPGDHGTLPARSISYAEAKVPYVPLLQGTMAHFLRVRSA